MQARQATISDVLFGKTNCEVTALLMPSPAPEMLPGIDGIIGVAALKAHHINFDFSARTLDWEVPYKYARKSQALVNGVIFLVRFGTKTYRELVVYSA